MEKKKDARHCKHAENTNKWRDSLTLRMLRYTRRSSHLLLCWIAVCFRHFVCAWWGCFWFSVIARSCFVCISGHIKPISKHDTDMVSRWTDGKPRRISHDGSLKNPEKTELAHYRYTWPALSMAANDESVAVYLRLESGNYPPR